MTLTSVLSAAVAAPLGKHPPHADALSTDILRAVGEFAKPATGAGLTRAKTTRWRSLHFGVLELVDVHLYHRVPVAVNELERRLHIAPRHGALLPRLLLGGLRIVRLEHALVLALGKCIQVGPRSCRSAYSTRYTTRAEVTGSTGRYAPSLEMLLNIEEGCSMSSHTRLKIICHLMFEIILCILCSRHRQIGPNRFSALCFGRHLGNTRGRRRERFIYLARRAEYKCSRIN